MTARDDYPQLALRADRPRGQAGPLAAFRKEAADALDELDRLRSQLARAYAALDDWDPPVFPAMEQR